MTAIEAVTFDFWNTLVFEDRGHLRNRRLDAWAGILEDAGFALERQQIDVVYDASWERYVAAWTANEQYQAVQAAEDAIGDLGLELPDDVRAALTESFGRAGDEAELHLTDGVERCLHTLHDAGVRLGIICDVGFTSSAVLREHLIRHGVLPLFDHWSFSDDVGAYKPSRVIFEHALEGLGGVTPERTAHVGDLRRTDVAGALAMGMTAVRYAGVFDDDSTDQPEAHHVVRSHTELPGVLGYGQ
ncbi:MAG: putative hydrolase of the superfamily [Actinomycetota bacterium]|jgi:putative hydrolase of the HAD superfamily